MLLDAPCMWKPTFSHHLNELLYLSDSILHRSILFFHDYLEFFVCCNEQNTASHCKNLSIYVLINLTSDIASSKFELHPQIPFCIHFQIEHSPYFSIEFRSLNKQIFQTFSVKPSSINTVIVMTVLIRSLFAIE